MKKIDFVEIFKIVFGSKRTEYCVIESNGKFTGKVNQLVIIESHDYDLVRESMLKGMEPPRVNPEELH